MIQSRNNLRTVISSYTDGSPAYRFWSIVADPSSLGFLRKVLCPSFEVFEGFISSFSISPRDGRWKILPTRKNLVDRARLNDCFREIGGPVRVALPELCSRVGMLADTGCPPFDGEILILSIWSGDTVRFIFDVDAWRPVFDIDDSLAEIDGPTDIPVTNLVKLAIAR